MTTQPDSLLGESADVYLGIFGAVDLEPDRPHGQKGFNVAELCS